MIHTRFARLAEAANRFAHAHRERGDGFQAFQARLRKRRTILPARFGEQELGIAENSSQWIVELVAKNFGKVFMQMNCNFGDAAGGF